MIISMTPVSSCHFKKVWSIQLLSQHQNNVFHIWWGFPYSRTKYLWTIHIAMQLAGQIFKIVLHRILKHEWHCSVCSKLKDEQTGFVQAPLRWNNINWHETTLTNTPNSTMPQNQANNVRHKNQEWSFFYHVCFYLREKCLGNTTQDYKQMKKTYSWLVVGF